MQHNNIIHGTDVQTNNEPKMIRQRNHSSSPENSNSPEHVFEDSVDVADSRIDGTRQRLISFEPIDADAPHVDELDDDPRSIQKSYWPKGGWQNLPQLVQTLGNSAISHANKIVGAPRQLFTEHKQRITIGKLLAMITVLIASTALILSSTRSVGMHKHEWGYCKENEFRSKLPTKDPNDKIEPLWLPAYPTSLPGNNGVAYAGFISALTGIDSSAKNYYRSSKSLKRCHSSIALDTTFANMGVTCEMQHPIVPCKNPHPSKQSDSFGKPVFVALRNPLTAFPAFYQYKDEKYHGAKGQVSRENWAAFRDQYVGPPARNATDGSDNSNGVLFGEWKSFIMEWRDMEPYHVALYLPYEDWFDKTRGIGLVNQIAQIVAEEGFPVLYGFDDDKRDKNRDLECMWYKHIHETIAAEEKKRKDDGWYVPDYTKYQKEMLASELEKFAAEIKEKETRPGDEDLIAIISEYREIILSI